MILNENELIKKIFLNSIDNKVASIRNWTAELLIATINQHNYKQILEIGTGVGYSCALILSNCSIDCIVSIEKDSKRFELANNNLKDFANMIELIQCDCFDYDPKQQFDFIFIDGPKKNQIQLIEKLSKYLNPNGAIFIDNIFLNKFRLRINKTSNQKRILKSLDELAEWIKSQSIFNYKFFNIDDGVAILQKKD